MGRIYSRPRRLNKRLCFYLVVALLTIGLVGYHWIKGGQPRPLSLFSTDEYSSDLPTDLENSVLGGSEGKNEDSEELGDIKNDEGGVEAKVEDDPSFENEEEQSRPSMFSSSFIGNTVKAAQKRMYSLFGLTGDDDNFDTPEESFVTDEGDGITQSPVELYDDKMAAQEGTAAEESAEKKSDDDVAIEDASSKEEEDKEDKEKEDENKEEENDGGKSEEGEDKGKEKEDKEKKEGKDDDEDEEDEKDDKKKSKDKGKDEEEEEEEEKEDKKEKSKDEDKEEKKEKDTEKENDEGKEEKKEKNKDGEKKEKDDKDKEQEEENEEEREREEEEERERERERESEERAGGSAKEDNRDEEQSEEYNAKQEEENSADGDATATSGVTFDGVDTQQYPDAEDGPGSQGTLESMGRDGQGQLMGQGGADSNSDAAKALQEAWRQHLEKQQQQRQQMGVQQTDEETQERHNFRPIMFTRGADQMGAQTQQMPSSGDIERSLGLTNDTGSSRIQQMYEAYRNATSDEGDQVSAMKMRVEEGKEQLKEHVSALQLLKMKQELVRYGLSAEVADRLLSSPNPQAVVKTLPPSAQLIIRREWENIREKLSTLKAGSSLEHIQASNDLLRPAENDAGMQEDGRPESFVSGDDQRKTTLPTGQGYDNPRPLSEEEFNKRNTPPGYNTGVTPPTNEEGLRQPSEGGDTGDLSSLRESLSDPRLSAEEVEKLKQLSFQREQASPSQSQEGVPSEGAEPRNLPPLQFAPSSPSQGQRSRFAEQAGQPQTPVQCPRDLRPSRTSHPVTALVAFEGQDSKWFRQILEQLSGEETDSIYTIMADLSAGHTTGVLLMGRKVAIETHTSATNDFNRAIVFMGSPFSVEREHKTLKPMSVDWQKNFLWGRLYTFWLHTDIPTHVVMYEDLLERPMEELGNIAEFLGLPGEMVNFDCAMEVARDPPSYVTDVNEIAGIYSKQRQRINDDIDTVITAAAKRFPEEVMKRLESYKIYPSEIRKRK